MSTPRRRTRPSEAEQADWAAFTSRIRPLPGRPAIGPTPIAKPESVSRTEVSTPPQRLHAPPAAIAIGEPSGGVDRATWQRFRTGRLRPARLLDLHGQTAQKAFQSLLTFVRSAYAEQVRCVEIVTGRGGNDGTGVLRRELPLWLNRPDIRPLILAAAHPHAANVGAVRLLLRRAR